MLYDIPGLNLKITPRKSLPSLCRLNPQMQSPVPCAFWNPYQKGSMERHAEMLCQSHGKVPETSVGSALISAAQLPFSTNAAKSLRSMAGQPSTKSLRLPSSHPSRWAVVSGLGRTGLEGGLQVASSSAPSIASYKGSQHSVTDLFPSSGSYCMVPGDMRALTRHRATTEARGPLPARNFHLHSAKESSQQVPGVT